jgi:uncharacterized protein YneF (UPF0154 family)
MSESFTQLPDEQPTCLFNRDKFMEITTKYIIIITIIIICTVPGYWVGKAVNKPSIDNPGTKFLYWLDGSIIMLLCVGAIVVIGTGGYLLIKLFRKHINECYPQVNNENV